MIDPTALRKDPDAVKQNCRRRGADVDVDALHQLDQQYLSLVQEVESLRGERKRLSKQAKTDPAARDQVRRVNEDLSAKEARLKELKAEVDAAMAQLPNFLAPDVPDGDSDEDNVCIREVGEKPRFDFEPRDHQALGEHLDIIDTQRGAKVAQSGFYYWKGAGAQLAAALFFWAQQKLVERRFTLFFSPCLAKAQTLFGTGYLPFFADQTYNLAEEDLALIGTSEQTLVAFHADEILAAEDLPRRYTAYTPCWRTEAGSYGKESRGIFRVHQFHKVEQIVFCTADTSETMHEECQQNEEHLLAALGLPYRTVNVCVGDLGAPGYKKYDNEAWFPGYGGYRELTSNTNLTDFQSRRLGIRYSSAENRKEKHFCHTISATAVTDRWVCAILENFQQEDGSVRVPDVLRPLTGLDVIRPA